MVQDDFPRNEIGRKNQNQKHKIYAAWFLQQKVINIIESLQMEFPKKVTTTRATENIKLTQRN